jgi:hypothetical protein
MAGITLEQFEVEVTVACAASPAVMGVSVIVSGVTFMCLRAYFAEGVFADAFYNEATDKTSFALIRKGQRILGADNTGGWHWHPFEDPESHMPVEGAVRFAEFLNHAASCLSLDP